MFSTLSKTNFNFSYTFILLSADALNLEFKNMLFGKELNQELSHEVYYIEFTTVFCKITILMKIILDSGTRLPTL